MPLKRSLALGSALSAALIFGALAAGAVSGISDGAHKAGEYSPVDPSRSRANSAELGADPASTIDGGIGDSSLPDLATPTGVVLATGPNNSSSGGSGSKPILNGSNTASNGGGGPLNLAPSSGAPVTTSTSFDDHGGDHESDDPTDDAIDDD
jgi:hypothetical protein